MDCHEVQKEIPALLYGELDESMTRRMKDHLDRCPTCKREWDEQKEAVLLLDRWSDRDLPFAFPETSPISKTSHHREKGFDKTAWYMKPIPLVAAACLLMVLTLGFLGFEVRHSREGFAISIGRSHVSAPLETEASLPAMRASVRQEMAADLGGLFQAVVHYMEETNRVQEQKRQLIVNAFQMQRENDLQYTRNLLYNIAQDAETDSARTRIFLGELADQVYVDIEPDSIH